MSTPAYPYQDVAGPRDMPTPHDVLVKSLRTEIENLEQRMVEIRQAVDFAKKDMAQYESEAGAIAGRTLSRIREKTFPVSP